MIRPSNTANRVAAVMTASACSICIADAHGAWLGTGSFDSKPASLTLLQNSVNAGQDNFQTGDFVELIAAFPVIVNGTLSGPGC
jgi:hypothetical protein